MATDVACDITVDVDIDEVAYVGDVVTFMADDMTTFGYSNDAWPACEDGGFQWVEHVPKYPEWETKQW